MSNPKIRFKRGGGTSYPDWVEKTIKEIAPLQRGFDLPEKERVNGKYPVVCSNGIVAYHNQYKCEGYAVITGRSGTIGNFTYLDKCRYWAHNTSLWVTDFCGNNPKFIYYFYHTIKIEQYSTGTGVPTLNRNNVHTSRHYIPCLEEQKKIADFLSTVDEVIAQSEAEVSNLQQQKKAAMQKIFSQEVRFKREDGSDYPKWNSSQISELFNISAGGDIDKANSSIEYSIEYPYAVYANALTNNGLYGYANYYKIEQDCFTVTGRGDVGCAIARHEKFVPIVRLLVCEPKHNENVDCFAEIVNNTDILVESTGVPQLTSIQLGKIRVSYPIEIEEQQKIADFLSAYDEAISYAKQELDKWRELKKGLLQQMFV